MRTPVAMIQSDSSVNRISVSQSSGLVAIPFDNRNVRIYDLSGNRIARLPRWVTRNCNWEDDLDANNVWCKLIPFHGDK